MLVFFWRFAAALFATAAASAATAACTFIEAIAAAATAYCA